MADQGQADRAAWKGEMFRLLAENVVDYALFIVDPHRHVLSWSKGAERLLGFTEDEIVGQQCDCFFTPEDVERGIPQRELDEALAGGRGDDDRWHMRKDGSRFWSSGMVTPLRDDGGTLRGFAKIMRDRTDLKKSHEALNDALAYAEAVIATVREPLVVLDGDLRVRMANRSFYTTFGVRPEDTEGRLLYDLGNRQWDIPALRKLLGEVLPQNTAFNDFAVEHDFPAIGRKVMLLNARKVYREGNHTELVLLAVEDVTALREAERARRDAETRFTEMVKNVRDHSIFLTDPDGTITSWNVAAERIIGYSEAEAVGKHFSLIFTPEDAVAGMPDRELRQAREEGRAEDERWHMRKNGSRFWALGIVTPLHDAGGRLTGYSKILRDMTEWKRTDEEARGRQRQLEFVTDHAPVLLAHCDRDQRFRFVNAPYAERFGLHPRDIIGRTIFDVLGPEAYASIRPHVEAALAGNRVEFEAEVPYEGIGPQTMRVAYEAERNDEGEVIGFVAAILNISDRKRAERRRTARLAVTQILSQADSLRAAAPDLLRAVCDSLGWSVGVLWAVDQGAAVLRCVNVWQHPPDAAGDFVTATRQRTFGPGESLPGRVWVSRRPVWVADVTQDAHFLRRNQAAEWGLHGGFACPVSLEGDFLGVIEFFSHDIREPDADLLEMMTTLGGQIGQFMERRRAEEQLAASRGRLQALFDNTLDAILLADDQARYVEANPAACKLLGYDREELLRRGVFDITPPPNREAGRAAWAAFVRDGHQAGEYTLTRRDGSTAVVEYRAVAHFQPGLHLSVLRDVTERRRTEEALRESRERLVKAQRIAGLGSWEVDWQTRAVHWSGEMYRLFGVSPDTFEPNIENVFAAVPAEDRPAIEQAVADALAGKAPYRVDHRIVRPDGAVRVVSEQAEITFDADGQPTRFVGATLDITERRAASEALRESEQRLRTLSDNLPLGAVYQVLGDREGRRRFLYISAGVERLFGVPPAEAMADAAALYGLVHEEDRARVAAAEEIALRDGTPFDCEFRSRTRSGGLVWVHSRSAPRPLPTGQVVWEGILVDVTARKAAERESEVYRGRLDLVVNSVDVGLWYCDLPFDRLIWNAKVKEHFGLPPEADVTIDTFYERLHPGDRERTRQAIERSIREHAAYDIEYRTVGLDGRERWVRAIGRTFYGPTGQPVSFDGITVDVTERVLAEHALRQSEERLRLAVENAGLAWWDMDMQGGPLLWSSTHFTLLGYDPAPSGVATIAAWSDRVHPDDRERVLQAFERARRQNSLYAESYRVLRADNQEVRWLTAFGRVLLDDQGRPFRSVGILYDDTERRQAERALRTSEERFRTLVVATSLMVWTANAEGQVVDDSPSWRSFTGQTYAEWRGYGWLTAVHPDDREKAAAEWRRAVEGKSLYAVEYRVRRQDGAYRWTTAKGVPLLTADGAVKEWFGTNTDITAQRELEQALKEADRRKDEFLATLAHELRNPLAPLRNGLQVMKLAAGNAEAGEQARSMMERQLGTMVRLVDDLLDVSRITRGKLRLRRDRVDLASVVQSAVEGSRPLIEANRHDLTILLPAEPAYLEADPTRLAQVFSNLLTNAAKYTDRGGRIQLAAERHGGEVIVSVRDSGIGIAPCHLPNLFGMFSQVDSALERSQGGLGIGLSLVKGLVAMHGGSIEARSEGLGKGSEFVVRLPVADGRTVSRRQQPARGERTAARTRRRILIADDSRDAADSLAMMLRLAGHEVHAAYDGQEAVEAAAWFRPDIALLDIGMPRLNGYEAARRIREQPGGAGMVLVAATGWGQEEDRRRATEAGFDVHLTKPVDPVDLSRLLERPRVGVEERGERP